MKGFVVSRGTCDTASRLFGMCYGIGAYGCESVGVLLHLQQKTKVKYSTTPIHSLPLPLTPALSAQTQTQSPLPPFLRLQSTPIHPVSNTTLNLRNPPAPPLQSAPPHSQAPPLKHTLTSLVVPVPNLRRILRSQVVKEFKPRRGLTRLPAAPKHFSGSTAYAAEK